MAHPFEARPHPFEARFLERAYTRKASLGVELLDAVTLERVTNGIEVTAKGLTSTPIVNFGGVFVWPNETDMTKFEKLIVNPKTLPFAREEILAAQVARPLHIVELQPLANYPFAPGTTAIRGSLIESRAGARTPIARATIELEWLDDDGVTFHPWRVPELKTDTAGDFACFLRLARGQQPRLDAQGRLTVRFKATRNAGPQKQKTFPLPVGRIMQVVRKDTDPIFAWDEM